jgi:hypothetical protein
LGKKKEEKKERKKMRNKRICRVKPIIIYIVLEGRGKIFYFLARSLKRFENIKGGREGGAKFETEKDSLFFFLI